MEKEKKGIPEFCDWRRMLSCGRYLARWYAIHEEKKEVIGFPDESQFDFCAENGTVKYKGVDIAGYSSGVPEENAVCQLTEDEAELPWAMTQFFPPEAFEESWKGPDFKTDRYVLAVLLFRMFFGCHPVSWPDEHHGTAKEWYTTLKQTDTFRFAEGRKAPEEFLYSYAAARWEVFPEWIKAAFYQTFTVGMEHPEQRISARMWLEMLEGLCKCYACIWDPKTKKRYHCFITGEEKNKKSMDVMLVLQTDAGNIYIPPGTKICEGDLRGAPGSGPSIGRTGYLKNSEEIGIAFDLPWEIIHHGHQRKMPIAAGEAKRVERGMQFQVGRFFGMIK